jgi:hypothetical protein
VNDSGSSLLLAGIALGAAVLAKPLWEIVQALREGGLGRQMPELPAFPDWERLYRCHNRVWRVVGNKVSGSNMGSRSEAEYRGAVVLKNYGSEIGELVRLMDRKWLRRKFILGIRKARKQYHGDLLVMRDIMKGEASQFRADLEEQLRSCPELHFALRVALPCLVELETSPGWVLRAATKPGADVDNIEELVRLDAAMQYHPKIEAWVLGGKGFDFGGRNSMVGQWVVEGMRKKVSLVKFKEMMGGLIAAMAEKIGLRATRQWNLERYRVDKPTIRRLFDAVARDSGTATSTGHDPDLTEVTDLAWAKAVGRQKDLWISELWGELDKKRA